MTFDCDTHFTAVVWYQTHSIPEVARTGKLSITGYSFNCYFPSGSQAHTSPNVLSEATDTHSSPASASQPLQALARRPLRILNSILSSPKPQSYHWVRILTLFPFRLAVTVHTTLTDS